MQLETWLITGGAGYVGSHIADSFLSENKRIVIYDSLTKGLNARINYLEMKYSCKIPFIKADIRENVYFENALKSFDVTGIVHTAALKAVRESFEIPKEYMEVNFSATAEILKMAITNKVKNFIFSSTAAVYGNPNSLNPCHEIDLPNPVSPYGESKLLAERCVSDFLQIEGNMGASLRFFNVVGTSSVQLKDNSVENLVPIILKSLNEKLPLKVYGDNYSTPDGTCIRDYVDVRDIARAHLAVANSNQKIPSILNIGSGNGASVRDVINWVLEVSGETGVRIIQNPPRLGDPASLWANVELAASSLGFQARYTLRESIKSLFN